MPEVARERRYKIHPAIGIARLGNADADDFFIGPEVPGRPAEGKAPGAAVPPYKVPGPAGPALIRPQAARFRVWEYAEVDGKWTATREIDVRSDDVVRIEWTAHLANRKASFFEFAGLAGAGSPPAKRRNAGRAPDELDIDPGLRRIVADEDVDSAPVRFVPGTSDDPGAERWPSCPGPNPAKGTKVIEYLGELRVDDAGRLIVLGGKGHSASNRKPRAPLPHYANNDNWWDDTSDGPVAAAITLSDGSDGGERTVDAAGAWVLVGPPDFAPGTPNVVTLYDLLYDIAVRHLPLPEDAAVFDGPLQRLKLLHDLLSGATESALANVDLTRYTASFNEEILPILRRVVGIRWVFPGDFHFFGEMPGWKRLADPSAAGQRRRANVFNMIRPPGSTSDSGMQMPRLWGDAGDGDAVSSENPMKFLTLTPTQYALLRCWRDGQFAAPDELPGPPPASVITPEGLDQAALENASGGSFFPGLETGWQIRAAALYAEPFRINHRATSTYSTEKDEPVRAGHFSRQMAVPWQADFALCRAGRSGGILFGWWPAQRPDEVYRNAKDAIDRQEKFRWDRANRAWAERAESPSQSEMVDHWAKFGFVLRKETDPVARPPEEVLFEAEREKRPFP